MIKLAGILNETTTGKGYTIYCDMDGVLCDFNGAYKDLSGGYTFDQYVQEYDVRAAWKLINDEGAEWWATLPWMKGGQELWKVIKKYNPTLLSAPSEDPSSVEGKKTWIKKNLGNYKGIFVPAQMKQNYADQYSILIDDYRRNAEQWAAKDGVAILHKDLNTTLNELRPYL
jgi:5'(3')-deoxyribonucleotidase